MSLRTFAIAPCSFVLAVAFCAVGCSDDNPLFCDADTPCTDPDRPFCDIAGEFPASDGVRQTCIPTPGDGNTCTGSGECGGVTPVCDDGVCAACGSDAECAEIDDALGVCSDSGACVECEDSAADCAEASAPICDGASSSCRGCAGGEAGDAECAAADASAPVCEADGACVECRADGDCATEVCDLGTGQCLPASAVVYVDADSGSDGVGCGGPASPCATIGRALDAVSAGRTTVALRPGTFAESVGVDDSVSETSLLIVGIEAIIDPAVGDVPVLEVSDQRALAIRGLTLQGATGANANGITCLAAGTALELRNVAIQQNAGVGLAASACTLTVTGSTIRGNDGGGVKIDGGTFTIVNNFIVGNGRTGAGGSTVGGLSITAGADEPQTVAFNTVVENQVQDEIVFASGIFCAADQLVASNNIVRGGVGATDINGTCTHTYSNIEGGAAGAGNIDAASAFVNVQNGDFHLAAGSPEIDAGDPSSQVIVDADGDERPQGEGFDIGADEVAP